MAKLLKAIKGFETGGLLITYRVGGDERQLWLSPADIDGLTPAQIKALAQSRADADTGADGSGADLREDVLPAPTRAARRYFADNAPQAVISYFRAETPAEMRALWDAATSAQREELNFWSSVIDWTVVQNEILD